MEAEYKPKTPKRSFMLQYDTVAGAMESLTDEEFGKLIKWIARYEMFGELPDKSNDRVLLVSFNQFKENLDYNREKWLERCKKNQKNIIERWNEKA